MDDQKSEESASVPRPRASAGSVNNVHEIEIENYPWAYVIDGSSSTAVYHRHADPEFILNWAATEGEVRAGAHGYNAGYQFGLKIGASRKVEEIRKALGI